ncbi:MAG: hypothetical protein KAH25_01935 [Bacteroidales bacterium]|nr:hypothetical protein [Bacteroidales bacterium]
MSYNSICSSCKHEANCIYIEHSESAITLCEEFELESVVKTKIVAAVKAEKTIKTINTTEYTGLCINCMNNETCNLHSDSSVIWHCETYKVA